MYGLAAIQQANGWAMAGAGACIVLLGLTVLSFLISMIPRLTGIFENKPAPPVEAPTETPIETTQPATIVPDKLPDDINAAATIFMDLTEELGPDFTLIDLHKKSKEFGIPAPHLSINRFRDAGILAPAGDGRFSWQPISE